MSLQESLVFVSCSLKLVREDIKIKEKTGAIYPYYGFMLIFSIIFCVLFLLLRVGLCELSKKALSTMDQQVEGLDDFSELTIRYLTIADSFLG